ncbi:MAG: ATP-dependent DNA helicase [Syntrophus sp. (in: bacteria)]|nr:ATP-dependent DNA helicase [Syntrophus sp. (in: bacteria)]
MIDYEKELNPEQLRVVMEERGPLLVIAGAGSGKTRTLTYRVARLIESGVSSERILLATFTNKAARSMLTRVENLIGRVIGGLWGGTFHHCAHLTLRMHAPRLDFTRNFSILDSEDARQLINTCITEAGIDSKADKFPRGDVIGDMISLAVNTETPFPDVVISRYPFFSHRAEEITAVAARYRKRKKELDMMDFDDLLFNWRELLLKFSDVREAYAGRFLQILVDEYQDTNRLQAEIIDLIASGHRNLMVVGDDSQSIYSFRGANYENIIRFPDRYPDCRIYKLETNYRSTPEILHLANLSITNNENQFQKTLRAVRERGLRPILVPARNVLQQADFVAQRILELNRSGIPLREMAVLYRAHYHSMEIQMELTRRGIPFEIRSGIRFFEQAHIKDVTCYLRILVNPRDEIAWKRVLGLYAKIGKATAEKVWCYVSTLSDPHAAVLTEDFKRCSTKGAVPGLSRFQEIFCTLNNTSINSPPELIDVILKSGYRDLLREKFADAASREEDLLQLANFASRFSTLEDFLSELALLTGITEESRPEGVVEDSIILSSIHQAKGLEWMAVFMVWCSEGMIPLARALKEPGGEEEERRLFYVAVTRAKDQLYLCYPLTDYARGMGHLPVSPSRFIMELSSYSAPVNDRPYDQWQIDGE